MNDLPDTAEQQAEDLARAETVLGVPLAAPLHPSWSGEDITFHCSCGQESCHGALRVIPIKVDGEKRVDLMTLGLGGTVLSPHDRQALLAILADNEWFGA